MNILTTSKNRNLTIQTMHVNENTNANDIWRAIADVITLEFFVDFGRNCVIEFDNVTLSSSDLFNAIDTIRHVPIACRTIIPKIIETPDQIDALANLAFIYNYMP